jgi:hypothetical protein
MELGEKGRAAVYRVSMSSQIRSKRLPVGVGSGHARLTRTEHQALIENERKLKDDQEERRWPYLLLREVVRGAGPNPLGRKTALLAIHLLREISVRSERQEKIQTADVELSKWVRESARDKPRRN